MGQPRAALKVTTNGRFLCVEITNLGAPAVFSGVIQPGRGTASAAIARTALWSDSIDAERRIETGQSATIRIAQRDRPPAAHEADDHKSMHPEGGQAWRMCFLTRNVGASLERICPVAPRVEATEHDGVVLTMVSDPPLQGRTAVKSVRLDGAVATDVDTGDQFRVVDSPRHYHAKTF